MSTFTYITFMHLADAFIQSDLQCIQAIHFLSVYVFPGNQTHNVCAANAMLYHWATGTVQIRLHSGDAFSLWCHLNSESALRNSLLKGMGDETDWFISRSTQKHRLLIKRIGTTRLDHAHRHFPVDKLGKSGFGQALSALAPCALDHTLGSLK